MKDNYDCKICGDEVEFFPEDYENGKHPTKICGYCDGGIPIFCAIQDSFDWGGVGGVLKMLWSRWIKVKYAM